MYAYCTGPSLTVSQEVIDEVEALRQSELERSAYQPQTIIGLTFN